MSPPTSAVVRLAILTLIGLAVALIACGAEPPPDSDDAAPAEPAASSSDDVQQEEPTPLVEQPQQQAEESQTATQPAYDRDGMQSADEDVELTLSLAPILGGRIFEQPIELVALPDGAWLVAEQRGSITRYIEHDDDVDQFGVLDLTESVRFGGERGLLSIALHPDFESEPYLFVYYTPRDDEVTRLSRFRMADGAAIAATELTVLEIPQPFSNHNGGAVRFGPDGMLYLGIGDGGSANDPYEHGQNRETLLGAIIRIDVDDIDADTPYRIPTDNPFLGIGGVRPEIFAYGLRNPWRMAFDAESGLLWVGDVGQNRVEEIAIVGPGENHGWNIFEGDECFRSESDCEALTNAVMPVATYGHDEGCSVTGGEVYRGGAIPALTGAYVFGDYCSGLVWGLRPDDGARTGWVREVLLEHDGPIASFARDRDGEIYVLTFRGPILKLILTPR